MKTLAIPFIKRDYCLDLFIEQIKKQTYPKKDLFLLFVDNSNDEEYGQRLAKVFEGMKKEYGGAKFISLNHKQFDHNDYGKEGRLAKHRAVVKTMKRIYEEAKGDLFIVEDDTLIPKNALEQLDAVCKVCEDAVAATGYSFYWHEEMKGRPNIWNFKMEGFEGTKDSMGSLKWTMVPMGKKGKGVESVGASGTGCILLKREFLDSGYKPVEVTDSIGFKGQDIHVGYWINVRMRKRIYVDWGIRLPHIHRRADGVVEVIGANVVIKKDGGFGVVW